MATSVKTFADASKDGAADQTITDLSGLPSIPSNAVLNSVVLSFTCTRTHGRDDNEIRVQLGDTIYFYIQDLGENDPRSCDITSIVNNNGGNLSYINGTTTLKLYAYHEFRFLYNANWSLTNIKITANYTIPTYTLTVTAGTGGTVSGGGTYEVQKSVTLTATPNAGYKFVKWSDGNTSATRTVTVTGNATYTAVFERLYYDFNYDNLLSFADWYYSNSNNPLGSGSGTVTADVINGTITVNGSGDFYTAYGAALPYYTIPVQTGQAYKFRYDYQATGGVQAYVFFLNGSGDYIYLPDGTYYVGCYDGSPLVFTPPSGCVAVTFRVGITGTSNAVFSNLALYKTSLDYAITNRQYRKSFVSGEAAGELYTPVIEGFDFKGWYTGENGTGIEVTALSSSNMSTTIYSLWEEAKPKIKNVQMIYLDKQISATNKVPCGEGFIISVELS